MPGDTGQFTVGYNPLSREGEIDRTATIYLVSDSQKFSETVFLKGYVNPRVRSIDEQFPYSLGTILCSRKMIFFGKVFMGGVSKEFLNCYNNSDNEVVLQLIGGSEFKPTNILTLSPKERGQFEIEYNTTKGDYGVNTSTFKMVTNGDTLTTPLLVRAEVQEDFSKLSIKQQQKAPIYNSKPTWNLGKVEQGEQIIVDIPISNLGFSPLIIRKIETGSFYLIPTFKKNKIKSGKVGTISITVDAERLDVGPYKRTITIITNDPKQSEVRQKVSFEVVKKKE